VTMARLGRIAGEYVMLILSGEAKEYPREKLAEINPQQPQAFVQLDCSPQEFIAELRCNHIHVVYGHYVRELEVLCRVLGIRPIVPGAAR
jgi:L-fucose isomerase